MVKLTELELEYIRENFKDKVPKEIADHLGISVTRVRAQITELESMVVQSVSQDTPEPTKERTDRPSVLEGMKSKSTEGVLVMTEAASERGDEFRKTHRPPKFDSYVGKIYRESK